mmetsp:Transcript_6050/g.8555  ORF Transcript_6050/g.8555 Transcript_6050/m.8555 type:complete len:270 (+) Transcript_6050:89-898(+)
MAQMQSLDERKKAQLKAWFASARRVKNEIKFELDVDDIFRESAEKSGSLGIDFVIARKSVTKVETGIRILSLAQSMENENGLGGVVWHCGRATCKLMSQLPELYKNNGYFQHDRKQRVLDLGCGTGLVGMTAFLRGADVTLTDYLPSLIDLTITNIQSNFEQAASIQTKLYKWGEDAQHLDPPFDFIFASDCLYDYKALPDLLTTLLAVSDATSVIYLTYKRRIDDRERPFFIQLQSFFDHVKFSPPDIVQPDWRGSGLFFCRLSGRRK